MQKISSVDPMQAELFCLCVGEGCTMLQDTGLFVQNRQGFVQ